MKINELSLKKKIKEVINMLVWFGLFSIFIAVVGVLIAAFGDLLMKDGLKSFGISIAVLGTLI